MSALTVTLGADINALKRSMASATQLVSASAKKMPSLSAAGLKVGLGAALAGGGLALAAGIKAVTSAADFERTKVAFTTLIGDPGKPEEAAKVVVVAAVSVAKPTSPSALKKSESESFSPIVTSRGKVGGGG